jgi:DGQHR domain-containing protein
VIRIEERIRKGFAKRDLNKARLIGAKKTELSQRISELFKALNDPLLSEEEVALLLAAKREAKNVPDALEGLCKDEILECSDTTARPLDRKATRVYRLASVAAKRLRLVGIETKVSAKDSVIQTACDGRLIRSFAQVARLDVLAGRGQQRHEIVSHITDIARGIENGTSVPSSIILVVLASWFKEVAKGEAAEANGSIVLRPVVDYRKEHEPQRNDVAQEVRGVTLDIPFRRASFDNEKGVLLVDGQQRTAALAMVDPDRIPSVPMSVNLFVADDERAKEIFSVANNTVKIKADHLRALIAEMKRPPGALRVTEQVPIAVTRALAIGDKASPFYMIVSYQGVPRASGMVIAQNGLFTVVKHFAEDIHGADLAKNKKLLARVISKAFSCVKETWPEAWGKRPADSKLMHSAGLTAISRVLTRKLEALFTTYGEWDNPQIWRDLRSSLERLSRFVVWTEDSAAAGTANARGNWRRHIRDRQVTPQDISRLASFLHSEMNRLDAEAAVKSMPRKRTRK